MVPCPKGARAAFATSSQSRSTQRSHPFSMAGFISAPGAAHIPHPTRCWRCCAAPPPPHRPITRRAASLSLSLAALSLLRPPAHASGPPSPVAAAYDGFAARYDALDGRAAALPRALGLADLRAAAIARAAGDTLEVGCGTGANFALYLDAPRAGKVVAVDVSAGMLRGAEEARRKVVKARPGLGIELVQGDVARLPFMDEGFNTVVDTFSLCVFPEPLLALKEMRRVLKRDRGARLLLVEHSLSSAAPLALWQNLTAEAVAATSKGCFWNQDVVGMAREAGLVVRRSSSALAGTVMSLELSRDDAHEQA